MISLLGFLDFVHRVRARVSDLVCGELLILLENQQFTTDRSVRSLSGERLRISRRHLSGTPRQFFSSWRSSWKQLSPETQRALAPDCHSPRTWCARRSFFRLADDRNRCGPRSSVGCHGAATVARTPGSPT